MDRLLRSVSGVRGIVGQSLTPEVALRYGMAFGAFLKGGVVVIGRDTRYHGPMIQQATSAGLLAAGCRVIDIGVVSTPTVEFAVRHMHAAGGVVITASHNSIEYNALKLIGSGGFFLNEKQSKRFFAMVDGQPILSVKNNGRYTQEDGWSDRHLEAIIALDIIDAPRIRRRSFKVVADCVGGTASYTAPELLGRLGCRLKLINAIPDGHFPRPPEPTPENLTKLARAVRVERADIGFAFDPDSDRLAIVAENGKPLGEEYTLALGLRYVLSKKKGPVVVNVSSSMMNDFVAAEAKVPIYRTKVGEINVSEKMVKIGAVAGGEGNGGLIYPAIHFGRDAFQAAAMILAYMAADGRPISQLAGELPRLFMAKKKIKVAREDVDFMAIGNAFPGGRIDMTDGIKISFDDSWVHFRLSNTEPIARLIVESSSAAKTKALVNRVLRVLRATARG